jgi:hypothetical protein
MAKEIDYIKIFNERQALEDEEYQTHMEKILEDEEKYQLGENLAPHC